ncbi:hypothetical protein L218DRAFT_84606 [Marasmius fiardii PR-910]|nr:hypothetical protein L218DRAFT_84606 [Marasmius fiardii PR-910]
MSTLVSQSDPSFYSLALCCIWSSLNLVMSVLSVPFTSIFPFIKMPAAARDARIHSPPQIPYTRRRLRRRRTFPHHEELPNPFLCYDSEGSAAEDPCWDAQPHPAPTLPSLTSGPLAHFAIPEISITPPPSSLVSMDTAHNLSARSPPLTGVLPKSHTTLVSEEFGDLPKLGTDASHFSPRTENLEPLELVVGFATHRIETPE